MRMDMYLGAWKRKTETSKEMIQQRLSAYTELERARSKVTEKIQKRKESNN